jgi:xylan 1,4-beta-xylosidase
MDVYRVGYRVNDVYTEYLKMGSPSGLRREEVRELAARTDGRPIHSAVVRLGAGRGFTRDVVMRENDVYLLTLER